MSETVKPHWERGIRCHGYWIGLVRIGWVGLPYGGVKWGKYKWIFTGHSPRQEGKTSTLRAAKRAVEKLFAEHGWNGKNDDPGNRKVGSEFH